MSHENSQTIEGTFVNNAGEPVKRWYNVDDTTKPLPLLHPFEQYSYNTAEEGVKAAKLRSDLHGKSNFGPTWYDINYFNRDEPITGYLGDKGIQMYQDPNLSVWGTMIKNYKDWREDYKKRNPNSGRFPADGNY